MHWRTLYRIGRRPTYSGLFVAVMVMVISVVALLPNAALVTKIFVANVPVLTKVSTVFALYGSLLSNFTLVTLLIALLFSILTALNVTLLTYYIRRRRRGGSAKVSWTSLGGVASGILGLGCAACGSIVLAAIASMVGGISFLAFLPLHGTEFSLLGLGLLLYSSSMLLQHINDPLVCTVKN